MSKEAQVDKLLDELDARHWSDCHHAERCPETGCMTCGANVPWPCPTKRVVTRLRKAEKVIEAARAVRVVLSAEYQAHYRMWIADGNEADYQWLKRQPTLEAAQGLVAAALADLDEGDTDGD